MAHDGAQPNRRPGARVNLRMGSAIREATIARARDLGVKLFIEDDTREGPDGASSILWLTQ
ncbi:hypothetical protein DFR50_10998 [Roseiarcus fermentans]|uniref:Uncharacterized protein n=1 Tax=Roseiarcus fermentans TaxID=1473586 RepID=A0A366FKU9_9HYPH|nr:hypothetical protein [Roseiarcus fermentans]RBP14345.1 hypothetical protein DFR50_10998 [Roseiarcus fermentans]